MDIIMKTNVLYAIKCICFFAILGLMLVSVYNVLKWKDTTGEYMSSVDQLYATPDNLIDVVFVGSSHCYCGIIPGILWEEYGISAFDMAVSGQDKDSAYHQLVELYKTQNPSVVYVDLYALLYDRHTVEANVYRNYLSMKISWNSISHISNYVEEKDKKSFFLRFPIIHTRYRELKKYDFQNFIPNMFGRGETFGWRVGDYWVDPEIVNDKMIGELSEKNRKWLNDLIELAGEHGSDIEFIVLPFEIQISDQRILNAAKEMLSAGQYYYTNFNEKLDQIGIDPQNDFVDSFHLNTYGAEKITDYLGKELKKKYDLPDHRGDKRYWQWESDLKWYENSKIEHWLSTTSNPEEYVSKIIQFSDGVTIISLEGDYLNSSVDYFGILEPLGIDYEEYISGGKWIYRDGELKKIAENVIGNPDVYYDISRYDSVRFCYYGPLNGKNVMFNNKAVQGLTPLTFVTYDTFLEKVIAERSF